MLSTLGKVYALSSLLLVLGCACLATGILFCGYLLASARNPEEGENLFSSALMAFAMIETFVFLGGLVSFVAFTL